MIFNGDVEGGGSPDSGVDKVRFADSTVWSAEQILTMATSYEGETINGISGLYPEGGDGDDEIISQGPASILSGGAGNDILTAGGYEVDILTGGTGDDVLRGDSRDDIYRFSAGFGQDIIDDDGGWTDLGNVVEFDATIAPKNLRVEFDPAVSTDVVLRIAGSDDRITIIGGQNFQTLGFVRFADGTEWTQADVLARGLVPLSENVSVPSNDDVLTGSVYDDVIDGGQGNDVLIGLAGDDHLIGGTGNDIFNAGPGLDTTEDIRGDDTSVCRW